MRFDAAPRPLSLLLLLLLHACLPACQPIRPCFPCGVACLLADSLPFPSLLMHHLFSAGRKQKKFIIISLA